MSQVWQRVLLGDVLSRSEESVALQPGTSYREITVRLWGRGVVLRGKVTGSEVAASRRYVARQGQFILSRIDARNGALGIVPLELDGAIVTNDFPLFRVADQRLLPAYLGWLCRTAAFVEECQRASEGTTNRVRLQEDRFLARAVPLPPLPEQRRAVARIEELAARIEEARALRKAALQEADAILGADAYGMFSRALEIGSQRLNSVVTLERGRFSHRPRNDPRFFGGAHPWIQIAEIENANKYIREWSETLNDDGLAVSRKFPRGSVLISIAATIGAVGILEFDCCFPDSIVAATPASGCDAEFLYYYLGHLRGHLEDIAPQSAQRNINLQILGALPFPKLALVEQRRMVADLDVLQAEINKLKQLQADTAVELDALLPSILDRAFRGEV